MNNERDINGRLLPGNKVALGHAQPFSAQITNLRRAFLEACTPERMTEAMDMLFQVIREAPSYRDRVNALQLFLDRALGKVKDELQVSVSQRQPHDLTGLSDQHLERLVYLAEHPDELLPDTRQEVLVWDSLPLDTVQDHVPSEEAADHEAGHEADDL